MFLIKWWKKITNNQNKEIFRKKSELVNELNEYSLMVLKQKKHLEELIFYKLGSQLVKEKNNAFLNELKLDLIALQKLNFTNRISNSHLMDEVHYLSSIFANRFRDLEPQDLKLCAYFRLGFNTKEIATIEGIDLNEVRFYKTAIRRKLNIDSKTSLKDFLAFEE